MAGEHWFADREWAGTEPLLPKNQPGARQVNDKRVISGIIHVLFQAALGASHHIARLTTFADRLRERGKPHKVIIIAVAAKNRHNRKCLVQILQDVGRSDRAKDTVPRQFQAGPQSPGRCLPGLLQPLSCRRAP